MAKSMILFRIDDHIIVRQQSDELRSRGLAFLTEYFPEVLPLVHSYADTNHANVGDVALLTITEVIIPELGNSKPEGRS